MKLFISFLLRPVSRFQIPKSYVQSKSRNSKSETLSSKVEISNQEFRFGGERLFLSGANQARDPWTIRQQFQLIRISGSSIFTPYLKISRTFNMVARGSEVIDPRIKLGIGMDMISGIVSFIKSQEPFTRAILIEVLDRARKTLFFIKKIQLH